jgi:CheY-like chemotaxis protein
MTAAIATTVLVVEDNQTVRTLLRRALERSEKRVLVATNARSALAIFDHFDEPVDLVVADVQLPGGMNGIQLAEEIRERDPRIGILLVSGSFDDPPGEFPELSKPFTLESLEQRIREVLVAARGGSPARIRVEA